MYLFVKAMYGHLAAFISSLILMCFSLHVFLSTTSLSEVSFAFEILLGSYFLIVAANHINKRSIYLPLAIIGLGLAIMTRYEAWLLLPLWIGYHFWRSRDAGRSAGLLIVLLIFPIYWMSTNYRYLSDPLPGGTMTLEGTHPVTLPVAAGMLLWKAIVHLGWLPPLLPVGVIGGVVLVVLCATRGKASPEMLLHLVMAGMLWCFLVWLVTARGEFQDRYLLVGLVTLLPFAGFLYAWLWGHRSRRLLAATILTVASFPLSVTTYQLAVHLLREHQVPWPTNRLADSSPRYFVAFGSTHGMDKIASWLAGSRYRDDPILMTEMDYRSVYLPLYFPTIGGRYFVVSHTSIDDKIAKFVLGRRPALLITIAGDRDLQARLQRYLAAMLEPERLVHTEGDVLVYDIGSSPVDRDGAGVRAPSPPWQGS
jgi:hypothetical protein